MELWGRYLTIILLIKFTSSVTPVGCWGYVNPKVHDCRALNHASSKSFVFGQSYSLSRRSQSIRIDKKKPFDKSIKIN